MAVMSPFSQIKRQFGPEKGPNAFNQRERNIMGEKIAQEQEKIRKQIPSNLNTASFFVKNSEKERANKIKQLQSEKEKILSNEYGLPRSKTLGNVNDYQQKLEDTKKGAVMSQSNLDFAQQQIAQQNNEKKRQELAKRKKELERNKMKNIAKNTLKNVGMTELRDLPNILSLFGLI